MGWRYNGGLCLIGVVVFIWVGSAEITQRIFSEYRQPFAITYLGVSLMVMYLPIAIVKDFICSRFSSNSAKRSHNQTCDIIESGLQASLITDKHLSEREEGWPLRNKEGEDVSDLLHHSSQLSTWKVIKYSLCLTPIWFFTEYLSNSALANASVASTTVLTSTSGLFTLFFGALLGLDSINLTKLIAVLVSMAGVSLTTFGKTWAPDEIFGTSE